ASAIIRTIWSAVNRFLFISIPPSLPYTLSDSRGTLQTLHQPDLQRQRQSWLIPHPTALDRDRLLGGATHSADPATEAVAAQFALR
ncbi:MAG: hypothetical protein MUE60_15025, partial [Candidatus Eisenbacteria bacterium]|nr:hypothetical protein [Candidatus Eisenbacteria bacterium]